MKKHVFHCLTMLLCITAVLSVSLLTGCSAKKNSQNLTKLTLNEVAHSIFYAPMYVAIEEGYFEEEGIDMEGMEGDDILEADEVFDVGDGRYLIVEC